MISLLFRELILTVGGIVVVSLIVALTITPMLSARLLKRDAAPSGRRWMDRLTSGFGRSLEGGLRLRWLVLLIALIFVVGGIFLLRRVGTEFLPEMDDGLVTIKVVSSKW